MEKDINTCHCDCNEFVPANKEDLELFIIEVIKQFEEGTK